MPGFGRMKLIFIVCTAVVALTASVTRWTSLRASDHIDGPQLANDHASDLGDTYAFLDPNDNSKVVLVMSANPFVISSEVIGQVIFDHNLRYRFEIENTGDAQPDQFVDIRFTRGVGRETGQMATISLPTGHSFEAPTTVSLQGDEPPPFVVTEDPATGVSFYAGAPDDPFFLDNTAANRFVLSSIRNPGNPDRSVFNRGLEDQNGRDTYAGFNILLIAVRLPAEMLRGQSDVIGINSVTQRQRVQIVRTDGEVVGSGQWITADRDGTPLVNNGLIPPARKDEYNGASTADDANGRFEADIVQSLRNLGTNDTFINMILDAVVRNGDILRLNLTVPNFGSGGGNNPDGGFGNMGGRRYQDDVADATFTLINNGVPLGDHVDVNDDAFIDTFPFAAFPIQPNPRGKDNVDDRTRL